MCICSFNLSSTKPDLCVQHMCKWIYFERKKWIFLVLFARNRLTFMFRRKKIYLFDSLHFLPVNIQTTKRFRFQQAKIRASTSSIRKASMLEIRTQRRGGNVEIKKTYFYNILFYYWNQQSVDGCWFMYVFFAHIFGIFLINNTIFSVFTNQKKKNKNIFSTQFELNVEFFYSINLCTRKKNCDAFLFLIDFIEKMLLKTSSHTYAFVSSKIVFITVVCIFQESPFCCVILIFFVIKWLLFFF